MRKVSVIDRLFLFLTILIASYKIVKEMGSYDNISILFFTIGFGVIIIASLLVFIMNFEVLANRLVVVAATLIPLSISLALVEAFAKKYFMPYLIFAVFIFLAITLFRYVGGKLLSILSIIIGHGIAGLIIAFLPFFLYFSGKTNQKIIFVAVGGILIGIGGMLLAFLKAGRPILSERVILSVISPLLFFMTLFFVLGV